MSKFNTPFPDEAVLKKFRVLRNGKCVKEIEATCLANAQGLFPRLVGVRKSKKGTWPYEWQRLEDNKGWTWV